MDVSQQQVFPYMYVPYPDDFPDDPSGGAHHLNALTIHTPPPAHAAMRRLAAAIDTALATQPPPEGEPPPEPEPHRPRQSVLSVQLVRACNMYGYHANEQPFIKIMLYVPVGCRRGSPTWITAIPQPGSGHHDQDGRHLAIWTRPRASMAAV